MSGRDEQPIKDYPMCPICKSDDDTYWRAIFETSSGVFGGICFNSDNYLKGYAKINATDDCQRISILDSVHGVICHECGYTDYEKLRDVIILVAKDILKESNGDWNYCRNTGTGTRRKW